jgi:hypothetical protein
MPGFPPPKGEVVVGPEDRGAEGDGSVLSAGGNRIR